MKKVLWPYGTFVVLSFFLTGCLHPTAHSIGSALMVSPLEHRVNGNDLSSQLSISASGFWGHTSKEDNVRDLNAGGGNVSLTYRLNGVASPLFFNVAAGAFGGSLKFACTESNCDTQESKSKYYEWLSTESGQASYDFWNTQQRFLVGLDFNPGSFLICGVAVGTLYYQGGASYEDARLVLDEFDIMDNVDKKYSYGIMSAYWIGIHLGTRGQFGNLVVEFDSFHKGEYENWTYGTKYTYTHPSGFFGGVATGNLMETSLYLGKTFTI